MICEKRFQQRIGITPYLVFPGNIVAFNRNSNSPSVKKNSEQILDSVLSQQLKISRTRFSRGLTVRFSVNNTQAPGAASKFFTSRWNLEKSPSVKESRTLQRLRSSVRFASYLVRRVETGRLWGGRLAFGVIINFAPTMSPGVSISRRANIISYAARCYIIHVLTVYNINENSLRLKQQRIPPTT